MLYTLAYILQNSFYTLVYDDRLAHDHEASRRRARGRRVALWRDLRCEQATLLLEAVELQVVGQAGRGRQRQRVLGPDGLAQRAVLAVAARRQGSGVRVRVRGQGSGLRGQSWGKGQG